MKHLEADICVVGGGLSGLTAATQDAEKGAQVVVFRRSRPARLFDYPESGCQGVHGRAAVRLDHRAVREELTGVLEDDDPVAEQAPALLAEGDDDAGGLAVGRIG